MRHKILFAAGIAGLFTMLIEGGLLAAGPEKSDQTAPTEQVQTLLENKIDNIIAILGQDNLSKEEKKQQIMPVIIPVIDFPLMAKLSLGKRHWLSLSEEQQKRYIDLFVKQLKDAYLNKITLYSGQKVIYKDTVAENGKFHVFTRLLTEKEPIDIVYKFYKNQNNWQVYDFQIEGVSFIKSYRSQFNEILRDGTVEDLFRQLEKDEVAKPEEQASTGK